MTKLQTAVSVCVLVAVPNMLFATYGDCRNAGGSMWDCFWEAAWNDGNVREDSGSVMNDKKIIKKKFDSVSRQCSRLPVSKQYECLSKSMKLKAVKKESKKAIRTSMPKM